jgi:hypothetical protein
MDSGALNCTSSDFEMIGKKMSDINVVLQNIAEYGIIGEGNVSVPADESSELSNANSYGGYVLQFSEEWQRCTHLIS